MRQPEAAAESVAKGAGGLRLRPIHQQPTKRRDKQGLGGKILLPSMLAPMHRPLAPRILAAATRLPRQHDRLPHRPLAPILLAAV